MYARMYAFAIDLLGRVPPTDRAAAAGPRPAYQSLAELVADLDVVAASLGSHGAAPSPPPSSSRCGAASSRSAPTSAGSTCARTPRSTRCRRRAARRRRGVRALPRARRGGAARGAEGRAALAAPAAQPVRRLQRRDGPSWPCSTRRPPPSPVSGRSRPALRHLRRRLGERRARGGRAAARGRARARRPTPPSGVDIVPLFETIDDLRRGHDVLAALLDHPVYARWSTAGAAARR